MRIFLAALCGIMLFGSARVQAAQVIVSDFTISGERPVEMRIIRGCGLRDRLNDAAVRIGSPVRAVDAADCSVYTLRGTASVRSYQLSQGLLRVEFSVNGELLDTNGCVISHPSGFATALSNGRDGNPYELAGQQACCQMASHVACYFRDHQVVYRRSGLLIPIGGGSTQVNLVITSRPRAYYREPVRIHRVLTVGTIRIVHNSHNGYVYRHPCR